MERLGLHRIEGIEVQNAKLSEKNKLYTDSLYARTQRKGALYATRSGWSTAIATSSPLPW